MKLKYGWFGLWNNKECTGDTIFTNFTRWTVQAGKLYEP